MLTENTIRLIVAGVFVVLNCTIGAVFLRAAIATYNKVIQVPSRRPEVPEPGFAKAAALLLASVILSAIAVTALMFYLKSFTMSDSIRRIVLLASPWPLSAIVFFAVLMKGLPAKAIDAVLAAITYHLLIFAVVAIVVVIVGLFVGIDIALRSQQATYFVGIAADAKMFQHAQHAIDQKAATLFFRQLFYEGGGRFRIDAYEPRDSIGGERLSLVFVGFGANQVDQGGPVVFSQRA